MMRSMLFVPGDSERKFARARTSNADALILDLEDSVAGPAKAAARQTVRSMLADRGRGAMYVRINALDTGLTLADLAAVVPGRPDGIVLPKSNDSEDIRQVSHWLDAFEAADEQVAGGIRIVAIATETAGSLFGLGGYAAGGPRLQGLMWGAEDLSASLGASLNRDGAGFRSPYLMARNLCLAGAAKAGVWAIDTVFTGISDLAGLQAEAVEANEDGFAGKAVIHPTHVDIVNAAFTPTEEAVLHARRVLAAFDGAAAGVQTLDGKMIDVPHLRAAQRVLERAASAGA